MGCALIRGIQALGKDWTLWASARRDEIRKQVAKDLGIEVVLDPSKHLPTTDILLLCTKPNQVSIVLKELVAQGLSKKTLLISVAAGLRLELLEKSAPKQAPVIRSMPNTPCVVGLGVTAICGGSHVTPEHIDVAMEIFSGVGKCWELEERHFDAVTGLSGSGPAYYFLMAEALSDGGVRVGLPRRIASEMVAQTMLGSAQMLLTSEDHPASLRDQVTTPAGCTIAALLLMEDGRIRSILARAIEEATRTAGQLVEKKRNKKWKKKREKI